MTSPLTQAFDVPVIPVLGAARSIWMPVTVLVVLLPALSVQVAVEERLEPSPSTTSSEGAAATFDSASVQVQSTVTSPVCQPLANEPLRTGAVLSTLTPVTPRSRSCPRRR